MEIIVLVIARFACNMYIILRKHQNHGNMIVFIWLIVIIVNTHINMLRRLCMD